MTRTVEPSRQAQRDLADLYAHIAVSTPAAADRFLAAAARTFDKLASHPGLGRLFPTRRPKLRGLRVWPVAGFPSHMVFYLTRRKSLFVVRVIHAARDLDTLMAAE